MEKLNFYFSRGLQTMFDIKNLKLAVGGFVVGAVLFWIVIFAAGWVVTSSTSEAQAKAQAQEAIEYHLSKICLYQFMQSENIDEHLQKIKDMRSWHRGKYIEEQGWATMPGNETPTKGISRACSNLIIE